MDKIVYLCTGGCGAIISQKQHEGGLVACGTQSCSRYRKPFEKRFKCSDCGALYKERQTHQH